MGYPFAQKAYKVYNLQTHNILISRDIIFHESHFPFHKATDHTSPFPTIYLPNVQPLPDVSSYPSPSFTQKSFPNYPPQENTTTQASNSPSLATPPNSIPSDITPQTSPFPTTLPYPTNASSFHDNDPSLLVDLSSYFPISPPHVRKSLRPHKQPSHLQDYICNNTFTHWCNLVSHTQLPLSHTTFLASQSSFTEPKIYNTAI